MSVSSLSSLVPAFAARLAPTSRTGLRECERVLPCVFRAGLREFASVQRVLSCIWGVLELSTGVGGAAPTAFCQSSYSRLVHSRRRTASGQGSAAPAALTEPRRRDTISFSCIVSCPLATSCPGEVVITLGRVLP
jgi:hypothetical protein